MDRKKLKKRIVSLSVGTLASVILSYAVITPVRAAVDKTYDQLKLFVDVLGIVQENYVDTVETKSLVNGAINGMIKTLDPFSQFMEPDVYREMRTETEGQFGGLGIRISIKDGWLTVITPLMGTPAYRAGILPEDKIVKIEDEVTQGISIESAVKQLRGAPGTRVKIAVAREGEKEPIEYTITREIVKIETVRSRMLEDGIGYVLLTEFNANSEKDLAEALGQMKKKGMKALVFDLRNNPGGLLDVAVDVCKEFLGNGKLVVYTQGRDPESRRDYYTQGKAPYGDLPMVILVNRGSASGSEIVAGAMQDLKRALIVGATTFGKGSVQSVLPLADGNALRLTTAKYYTPSGRSIHRDPKTGEGGIVPDIVIEIPRETEAKLYMQSEQIFVPGKDPRSTVKKEDRVRDVVLDRAVELLKARELFVSMNQG